MKKRQPDAALVFVRPAELDIAGLLRRASPALLVVGAWLAFHPYTGIVHDARLYVAQALHALDPGVYDRDLFFAFGSQDAFTLFSRLFAPLVGRVGPSAASMLVVAVGQALWLSGAAALALRLAPSRAAAVAGLALVAVMPASYGGWQVFSYGEGFATPRLLAEGFGLWALWALTDRRLIPAAVLIVAAALIHPIMAATVIGVGFCFLVLQDWRWLLLGLAGAAAAVVLAYAGVAPFDGLLRRMDAAWLAVVQQRTIFLFPSLWRPLDWSPVMMATATALAGAAVLSGWQRRLLFAGIAAGLGGLAVAHLGADLLHNLFLTEVQPWRTLWLLQVFAYLGMGVLVAALWRLEQDGLALIALVGLSWLASLILPPVASIAVAAFVLALAVARLRGAVKPLSPVARGVAACLTGLVLGFLVVYRVVSLKGFVTAMPDAGAFWGNFGRLTVIEVVLAAIVATVLYRRWPNAAKHALPVAALVLALASAGAWDRRAAWTRVVAAEPAITAFETALPRDAQVFWEGDVLGSWLLLHRPSYFSRAQGAGIVFRRATALAYRDRAHVIEPLVDRDLLDSFRASQTLPPPPPALTRSMLASACRADSALDAMVLSRAVPGAYAAEWDTPAPIYDLDAAKRGVVRPPIRRLYLYRCADLR